jgi:hypothetical protein
MLFSQPVVSLEEFESRSGWHLQPEGLCRDDVCIPLSRPVVHGNEVDVRAVADVLGMPLVEDAGLLAIGPRAATHVLHTAAAPEVILPDVHGNPFNLASLRGTKVLLLAWASW